MDGVGSGSVADTLAAVKTRRAKESCCFGGVVEGKSTLLLT
ncbi:hypothetical protein MtrunA17_Chr5g0424351 [Medicago truncatula]|uniref:Uncharacterized protein n=1 Tax=Medicago truncatula TaxID=3880 RepID=A0A396HRI9_MEDTR|nr:hypothetical protein MtrunA17_Chr5g0424351 [Medicago truncatula]